jgi:RecA/RadA recombinase
VCAGNLVRNAQKQGCQVILFDSENALDKEWLEALSVDTSPEKLLRFQVGMIDDVAKTISDFIKSYKQEFGDLPYEEQPKMLFVIDSLGMLLTPTDVDQFQKGDMKGDMGRKAKSLTALVRNTVSQIAPHPIGVVATNHTYASQDMFDPDDKISGGSGFVYASSIVVAMKKLKLKEDEDGNKISQVRGIRAACKVMKTRYSKPFESVQIKIPYETGMDINSGLLDFFEAKGVVEKTGNKFEYVDKNTGEIVKLFRKQWESNHGGCLDLVRSQWDYAAERSMPVAEEEDLSDE